MPAEYLSSWNPTAIGAAHNGLRDLLLDVHPTNPSTITVHASNDTLLATIPLAKPSGTVNGASGALTLVAGGREDSAPAGGTANYATLRDGSGNALRSLPCEQGSAPVSGKCVLRQIAIVQGTAVELVSMVIS
jgi:hypothetical protein